MYFCHCSITVAIYKSAVPEGTLLDLIREGLEFCNVFSDFGPAVAPFILAMFFHFLCSGICFSFGVLAPLVTEFSTFKCMLAASDLLYATVLFEAVFRQGQ